ncbi:MAG: DUF1343 domain-containing protein [Flavobacteriales bacterium]|nr:DUF1343 domain-containing protein [Flavobacteriales bacterium]
MGKPTKIAALLTLVACNGQGQATKPDTAMAGKADSVAIVQAEVPLQTGAERMDQYLPLLQGKRVAVVTNQTGMVGTTHLVDTLLARGVQVVKVFAPEHGFRGEADAGEHVADERDKHTGLPVISLYGKNKKPQPTQLADVDVVIFDIQDVGVRFFTYISTVHYVMEAVAEQHKQIIVLDRPNPNGFSVDGPVLDTAFVSFVGMDPVPLVHGMTVGEYARMVNGEGWLKGGVKCELTVVPCTGYDHGMRYMLPVKPSPNLSNMAAVHLYPSLGLFEGTIVSVGRGTDIPFQCIGYPENPWGDYVFTPKSMPGAKDPPYKGVPCVGADLRAENAAIGIAQKALDLQWLLGMYEHCGDKPKFFNSFFNTLAGGPTLRKAIEAGRSEEEIRESWQPELDAFLKLRQPYLLYP